MRFAIIWTWLELADIPDDNGFQLEPKQRVGYFTTLAEAQAAFETPFEGEVELVTILATRITL
jgi:hypothetical protein